MAGSPRGTTEIAARESPWRAVLDLVEPDRHRSASGDDPPLLVGAGAAGVLGQIGAAAGASHAVDVLAGRAVGDPHVVGVGQHRPLLVGVRAVTVLNYPGPIGRADAGQVEAGR